MNIISNYNLLSHNSFRINHLCDYYMSVFEDSEIRECLDWAYNKNLPVLIIGGGSNLLFTTDFCGLILNISIIGIKIVKENESHIWLEVGAGVVWNDLVQYVVERNWGGIENLVLIPGKVGAAPIQNIGAYGVEVKETIESVTALDRLTKDRIVFQNEECHFSYRDSIFKSSHKDRYIITSVTFKLSRHPSLNLNYGLVKEEMEKESSGEWSIKKVSETISRIRKSKLPDPEQLGNAGSFFKNPEIPESKYAELLKNYPDMPSYPTQENMKKIPAAWLIEKCGWKGKRFGNYGVHEKQALVLVNYGGASGLDIYQLSIDIQESIKATFGVDLEREVNLVLSISKN